MAISKCGSCESHTFELKANEPKGSQFKLMFVQCSRCGAVVGVTDYYNIPSLLEKLAQQLGFSVAD